MLWITFWPVVPNLPCWAQLRRARSPRESRRPRLRAGGAVRHGQVTCRGLGYLVIAAPAPCLVNSSNMCSNDLVVKLRREWDRKHRRWTYVEAWWGSSCPGCHQPYRGGHMAVGWLSCGCVEQGHHRTLYCRDCGCERFLPPHLQEHGPAVARA